MVSNTTTDHNSGILLLENLLRKNDVKGAIEFAKKVQTSSRHLKRISRFLAQIVVQVSSDDEEIDWYSDVEPNVSTKKARNVVPTQLHEQNAALMGHSGHNAEAAENPEKDGCKTPRDPDSESRSFDGYYKTQESLADKKLNAFYATIENDLDYLLDLPANK